MKQFVWLLSLSSVIVFAEPSVYGNNQNTYSSSVESKNLTSLTRKIAEQNERINGLMSIVEGLSATVNELQYNTQSSGGMNGDDNTRQLLQDLGVMIDKINVNYVSKKELQKALKSKGAYKASSVKKKVSDTERQESLKGKSTAKLYSAGVRLFVKKRYDEAKKRFTLTDTKGYKPAASNYYLGEISYYSKKYEDAIFYFKKSAGLYDKASYIDTLLLHTAISLERTGEKAQAKAFYENIVENYEGKKTASIAKQKLKKL
ncbi:MAG: hypothetical protein COA92_08165 [Sulfurovum sp.]|nr:MAG: hypothetical protein COA92_08165 [Sulfurovum sp.]